MLLGIYFQFPPIISTNGVLSVRVHTCLPFLPQAGTAVGRGSCRRGPQSGGAGSEYMRHAKYDMLWKPPGAGKCFSLPDLVSLAIGQALGNPEVSGIRNSWILIFKNPKTRVIESSGSLMAAGQLFLVSPVSSVETVTSQSWVCPRT